MRLLADTNIVVAAVTALRSQGHDVVFMAERAVDPGDAAILDEALAESRILISKDNDIGTLIFKDGAVHAGVLLINDLGSAAAETRLIVETLAAWRDRLLAGSFIRAGRWGSKRAAAED